MERESYRGQENKPKERKKESEAVVGRGRIGWMAQEKRKEEYRDAGKGRGGEGKK
jgi:hypothetical protein